MKKASDYFKMDMTAQEKGRHDQIIKQRRMFTQRIVKNSKKENKK